MKLFYKTKSIEFGKKIKSIRKSFGYTQLYVSQFTKISVDSLRRIENGYVTPKIETLVALSQLYKQDILKILILYCQEPILADAYAKLQYFIDTEDVNGIVRISKSVSNATKEHVENGIILIEEVQQFVLFCNASANYIKNTPINLKHSKSLIVQCLRLSINDFSVDNVNQYVLNIFEVRMLNLLALIEQRLGMYKSAIRIMEALIDKLSNATKEDDVVKCLNLLYFNLSYSYYEIGLDDETLNCANKGIEFSIRHGRLNEMHLLYYRKGIAEYRLGLEGYRKSLLISVALLEAIESPLAELYRKITSEQYGIEI